VKRWIFAAAILCLIASRAIYAQDACSPGPLFPLTPATLPTAPSSQAQVATFSGSDSVLHTAFSAVLWRDPCPSNASQSLLYLRVTPTMGAPFVCSTDFNIIQNGNQYTSINMAPGNATLFCAALLVPTTAFIFPQGFDPNQAFTLIYKPGLLNQQIQLAAASTPGAPSEITPQAGLWWNAAESGSGYALDYAHGVLVVTVYSYTTGGAPIWYLASGPVTNNVFTSTLDKYQGGQCISCAYRATAINGNDGNVSITFTSPTTANMTLPGGRSLQITKQPF
jgi:hypothetical protein